MQFRSASSSLFSTRELRRLLILYRSRELTQLRSSAPQFFYTIYGSMRALSPNQRALFRTQVNRFDAFKGTTIKLSLFPASIAQVARSFSNLRQISSLLKGSIYQRAIQIKGVPTIEKNGNSSFFEKQMLFQKIVPLLFDFAKSIRFSEDIAMGFAPALVIPPRFSGVQIPRRANQLTKYSKNSLSPKEALFLQRAQINAPSCNVISNIIHQINFMPKINLYIF